MKVLETMLVGLLTMLMWAALCGIAFGILLGLPILGVQLAINGHEVWGSIGFIPPLLIASYFVGKITQAEAQ